MSDASENGQRFVVLSWDVDGWTVMAAGDDVEQMKDFAQGLEPCVVLDTHETVK